ncbi:MAG: tetratricopeptide repeat protein [Calditrichaeota bacterium]|nr:MAG: tetratricopeptide repeat protein [Calditrichota bacterium]
MASQRGQRSIRTLILLALSMAGCATSRFQTIELYVQQRNWQKARTSLEEFVRRYPRDGEAHLLLAEIYGETDRIPSMMRSLQTVRRLSPRYNKPAEILAKRYWVKNLDRGLKLFRQKDYRAAAERFGYAVQIDSSAVEGWQRLGDALFMTAHYRQAEKAYRQALALTPENPAIKNNLAETYFAERNYAKAIQLSDEILAANELDLNALMRRAYAYDALGRFQDAEAAFLRAAALNPDAKLLTDFGLLYFRREKYARAIELFQQALEVSDNPIVQLRYLGEANWRLRNYREMVRWYEKIVASYPEDLVGWKNLAVAYEALGQTDQLALARRHISRITSTN